MILHRKQFTYTIIRNVLQIIITVGVAMFIVVFCSGKITAIEKSIQEKRQASLLLERRAEHLELLRDDIALVGGTEKILRGLFPTFETISDYTGALESVAKQTSINTVFTFGSPVAYPQSVPPDAVSQLPYTSTLNGSVSTITNYLRRIESLPYLTSVSSVSLQATGNAGWEGDTTALLQLKAYVK